MREMNLSRLVQLLGVSALHTKLTVPVGAPRVKLTVFIHSYCVIDATLDLYDIRKIIDLLWEFNHLPIAMTENTILAEAPCVHLAFLGDSYGVLEPAGDIDNLLALHISDDEVNLLLLSVVLWGISALPVNLPLLFLFLLSQHLLPVSKLALVGIPPRYQAAIVGNANEVRLSASYFCEYYALGL